MSLWVDKYRPKSLDELTYHSGLTKRLKTLVRTFIPEMLNEFPSCRKYT